MHLLLTTAANDRDLVPLFGDRATLAPIKYGDVNGFGLWLNGTPITISGERKRTMDLVRCIQTGRHLQQVQDALQHHDQTFLVWERDPRVRPGTDGTIEVSRRGKDGTYRWCALDDFGNRKPITYYTLDSYLNQLDRYYGVQIKESHSAYDTVQRMLNLFAMYQTPPEEHKLMHKFYAPLAAGMERPGVVARVAKELPHVGWKWAHELQQRWPTVEALHHAIVSDGGSALLALDGMGMKKVHDIRLAWMVGVDRRKGGADYA